MLQDIKIREMSKEEYFFLTENLEFVDKNSICNGVRYLVYNKKKRLLDVVQKVMQNELTEDERNLAIDYWSGEYSLGEISKRNNITRSAIYRHIDSIKEKAKKDNSALCRIEVIPDVKEFQHFISRPKVLFPIKIDVPSKLSRAVVQQQRNKRVCVKCSGCSPQADFLCYLPETAFIADLISSGGCRDI